MRGPCPHQTPLLGSSVSNQIGDLVMHPSTMRIIQAWWICFMMLALYKSKLQPGHDQQICMHAVWRVFYRWWWIWSNLLCVQNTRIVFFAWKAGNVVRMHASLRLSVCFAEIYDAISLLQKKYLLWRRICMWRKLVGHVSICLDSHEFPCTNLTLSWFKQFNFALPPPPPSPKLSLEQPY